MNRRTSICGSIAETYRRQYGGMLSHTPQACPTTARTTTGPEQGWRASIMGMVTIYLDQAKWIDLGRAMHGRPGGERFRAALDVARHCVAMELVEFPLSVGHYIETWRTGASSRRRRLAHTMLTLSRGRTLARPPDLCDNELDAVVSRLAELDLPRAPYPALGWGFAHASGLNPIEDIILYLPCSYWPIRQRLCSRSAACVVRGKVGWPSAIRRVWLCSLLPSFSVRSMQGMRWRAQPDK